MGHDVVGMQADQQVREEPEVEDLTPLPVAEAPDRHATRLSGERHGVGEVLQLHVASDPEAVVGEVLTGVDRRHGAESGVDRRTVVALVVVLGDRLPIGGDLVRVGIADEQALRLP